MNKVLILTVLAFQSLSSFSQSYWKIENEYRDQILLTIDLNIGKKTFEAYTRKDALKDLAGVFMYTLAKASGKVKYAEIVFIQGKTKLTGDSLFLTGTFTYIDKQYLFSASISGNQFKGQYIDTRNRPHPLTGIKVPDRKPVRDYEFIINQAFLLTEKNLLNPGWLISDEWLDFRKKVNELKPRISDDYELAATFFWLGKKLPFSPYEINKSDHGRSNGRKSGIFLSQPNANTVVLSGNNLPETKEEIDSIVVIINKKGFNNLIIDLRGRNRLNPEVANELVNYLSANAFFAGVYLTRKWFDTHTTIPGPQDYKKHFKGFSDGGFWTADQYKEPGRYLSIVPGEKSFRGKTYVLTNSKTSKVSETLAYTLKKGKIATIVGQKSAGSTILTQNLHINNEYDLILPVSDFYTDEGKSLENIGIEPDITVSGEDSMIYLLKLF